MRLVILKDTEVHKTGSVVEIRDDIAIQYLTDKVARVVGRSEQEKTKTEKATVRKNKATEKAGGE